MRFTLTPAGRHAAAWLRERLDAVVLGGLSDRIDSVAARRILAALTTAFTEKGDGTRDAGTTPPAE